MKTRNTFSSVLLWSIISAAFIGPGTVTTAVSAGSQFQLQLLWTVAFATIACILLQEVSARITIASGLTFGQAIEKKFGLSAGYWINGVVGVSVISGCAAYEAGNLMGAVSGLRLLWDGEIKYFTIAVTCISAGILWSDKGKWISIIMTTLVGLMGIAFLILAWNGKYSFSSVVMSTVTPVVPPGSELLTLGLIGTTIVPYNLFLGSGISKGQTIKLMRTGLIVSVLIGGLITAWILMAGTMVGSFSSFAELATAFKVQLGVPGVLALGIGLFVAGFSSAITSPYAASVIARTVFMVNSSVKVRLIWGLVLLTGFLIGVSGLRPIPVILTVQALNGFLLPLLTAYLILIINDKDLIPEKGRHPMWYNIILLFVLGCVLMISLTNIYKSITQAFSLPYQHLSVVWWLTIAGVGYVSYQLIRRSRS